MEILDPFVLWRDLPTRPLGACIALSSLAAVVFFFATCLLRTFTRSSTDQTLDPASQEITVTVGLRQGQACHWAEISRPSSKLIWDLGTMHWAHESKPRRLTKRKSWELFQSGWSHPTHPQQGILIQQQVICPAANLLVWTLLPTHLCVPGLMDGKTNSDRATFPFYLFMSSSFQLTAHHFQFTRSRQLIKLVLSWLWVSIGRGSDEYKCGTPLFHLIVLISHSNYHSPSTQ